MSAHSESNAAQPIPAARPPITRKLLLDWAGEHVFRDGVTMFEKGLVEEAAYNHPFVEGAIRWASRTVQARLRVLPGGAAENLCPCRDSTERGIICAHVVALGLSIVARNADPQRETKHAEELRRARRQAQFKDGDYIRRTPSGSGRGVAASLHLVLDPDWPRQYRAGAVNVRGFAEYKGLRAALEDVPCHIEFEFSRRDESLLYVLEDISEGPARNALPLKPSDFVNILHLMRGRGLQLDGGAPIEVHDVPMGSYLHMDLDRENGELILNVHTELPFARPGEFPFYVFAGNEGWVHGAGHFWPLEVLLPPPLRGIYTEPIIIPRPAVPSFLRSECTFLAKHMRVVSDVSPDLFTIEPAQAHFRLVLRGSPASLAPALYADYADTSFVAGKNGVAQAFAVPDPRDLMRYTVRNPASETDALAVLRAIDIRGETGDQLTPIVGCREVLNFLGARLPALRRLGWRVELEGKVAPFMDDMDVAMPVVRVDTAEGANWFDVDFSFEHGEGSSLTEAEIQRAMLKGDSYVERNGKTVLFDADAIRTLHETFSDILGPDAESSRLRMSNLHAAFVKSSLDALDGVDVEASPAWRRTAGVQNRSMHMEPVPLGATLEGTLRSYQKDAVNWLRFLERNNFGGILADEMGLGKTLETLAWLQLQRAHAEENGKPALIVCPTSLVENWAEEAHKFTPRLKVRLMTGPDRHQHWDSMGAHDLVVTSYALMRRDVDRYVNTAFAAIILDEAQHIKNRSTQNALAAKQLRARHRLVLTGTPIENSVSDLWSIMDFLMPGYLGPHEAFRQNYELPIERSGSMAEVAQTKLRRKLHPFLLRRLKTQVAADLPPKIERISSCTLTADQKMVYKKYLEASRRKIQDMVADRGFQRSRMEILKVLLRLRQVCCHLELLKLEDLRSEYPSAKMDLFLELVDEAVDGGHRILVFSQFTSMLKILARELNQRGFAHCYLDGATQDRMAIVREFNTNRAIPLFLISLKAGGTGLNLTGADMVIHFDPWWNPAVEDQATDRAHRIGQKKTVYSIKLITKDTVEEKVLAMQKKKRGVINATVESSHELVRSLTWDDVQSLLTL